MSLNSLRAQSIQNSLLHPFLSHLVMWRVCLFAFLYFFTMLNWVWMQRKFWNSIQAHFLYSFIIVFCVCVLFRFCCPIHALHYTKLKGEKYAAYFYLFVLFYSWNLIQLVFLGNGHTIIIQENALDKSRVCPFYFSSFSPFKG